MPKLRITAKYERGSGWRVHGVCALNGEYKSLFNGKDTRRVKVSYARGNARSISKSQGGLK